MCGELLGLPLRQAQVPKQLPSLPSLTRVPPQEARQMVMPMSDPYGEPFIDDVMDEEDDYTGDWH